MPSPLKLSDSEIAAIMAAARPAGTAPASELLEPYCRGAQRAAGARGEGVVHRAITAVWREHFDPPLDVNLAD